MRRLAAGAIFVAALATIAAASPLPWGEGGVQRRVGGYSASIETPYPLTRALSPWERELHRPVLAQHSNSNRRIVVADNSSRAPSSGSAFLSDELKALQADEFANPGMLWVGEGERLWGLPDGAAGKSCASCHGNAAQSMKGVAARYPAVDAATGKLLNLELRINACRTRHMAAQPLAWETNELLSLTAWLAYQSRGMPMHAETGGAAAAFLERGKAFFNLRQGQLNLSCAQCHIDQAGRRLRGDKISHGVGVGYPVHRLEWQGLGSLHRRLRSCSLGVRAVQFDYGSDEYLSLELYLAQRAEGLILDSPAIRK